MMCRCTPACPHCGAKFPVQSLADSCCQAEPMEVELHASPTEA